MAKAKEENVSRKRSPLILVVVILLVIIGSAGGAFAISKYVTKTPPSALAQSESQALASKVVMMPLSAFTINLAKTPDDNTPHYIKISLTVSLPDDKAKAALKSKLPIVRDSVISVLSQKSQNDIISTNNDLQTLKNQLKNKINNNVGLPAIQDVYITDMVLQ